MTSHRKRAPPSEYSVLAMIALEQFQKRGLRARRALGAAKGQALQQRLDRFEVEREILQPQARALANTVRADTTSTELAHTSLQQ